jgi:S-formylglutathione hydrolase FrmB
VENEARKRRIMILVTLKRASHIATSGCLGFILLLGCHNKQATVPADHPHLSPNVVMRDVAFHSASLNREMPYRVVLPASISPGSKLPVIYLLHGGDGGFRDWSNYTDVARFAEHGLILVMPDAGNSYYTNSAEHPQERYEDYIVRDLISDVETRFPVASDRAHRAILGISMGGFGAIKLSLHHLELFSFAGGLSSAIDVPNRPFSVMRIGQWRQHRAIFGAWGSPTRRDNDPFVLARTVDPVTSPYFYLTCGDAEGLLPANRSFAHLLDERHFHYEFHVVPGGHNWNQWNACLEDCFSSLLKHLGSTP